MKRIIAALSLLAITLICTLYAKDVKFRIVLPSGSKTTASDNVYYNYRGQNPNRTQFIGMPYEKVDPFTGCLNIVHTDLELPGKNGLDLKIQRYYNSSIWRDVGFTYAAIQDINTTTVGLGWTMHMGRVIRANVSTQPPRDSKDEPVIEMADGSQHIAYTDKNNTSKWITKEGWRYELISGGDYQLTMTNGVKYIYSAGAPYTVDGFVCYPVKRIEDAYGNYITIYYTTINSRVVIDYIVDTYSRTVDFNYSTTTQLRLSSITANSKTYSFNYSFFTWGGLSYPQLTSVNSPSNLATWSYEYTTAAPLYELNSITTPQGGEITYTYTTRSFVVNGITYQFYVVDTRSIGGGTWNFDYYVSTTSPDYHDSTRVTAPDNTVYIYTYHGGKACASSGNTWQMGLPVVEKIGTTQTKTYTWAKSSYISDDQEWVFDYWDEQTFVPYLQEVEITRDGEDYTTSYSNYDTYHNPQTITEVGQKTRTTTLTYFNNDTYYIHGLVATKGISVTGESPSYNTTYTRNSQGKVTQESKYGVVTSYTYTSEGDLTRTTDDEGNWVELSNYDKGVPKTINYNNLYSITRTVNWEGTIASETNGRGYSTSYTYDNINRLTGITPPAGGSSSITYESNNTVEKTTRDGKWSAKLYDNLGRASGTSNNASPAVYTSITYNSMGWKNYESYPYTSTSKGRSFEYDVLGRVTRIINPDNSDIHYNYGGGTTVVVTDERDKSVTYTYSAFGDPDDRWLMGVSDATGTTTYTRTPLGTIKQISQGSVTRTYTISSKEFLTGESHPETGSITYTVNDIGQVTQRSDAVRTIGYSYDDANRLVGIDYPGTTDDVTITYTGDVRTGLSTPVTAYSFGYDNANRLTSRSMSIDSRSYPLSFAYDARDNISTITYPDNSVVRYNYDNADRVTSVTDNGSYTYATVTSYHPSGGEAGISYNNGKTATITYDANRYWVSGISVSGGLMSYAYGYDYCGNLTSITGSLNGVTDNYSFGYDDVGRMNSVSGPYGSGSYYYDQYGNRTSKSVGGSVTYTYSNNRLTTETNYGSFTYNSIGEMTECPGYFTMSYDPAGRLYSYSDYKWYDALDYLLQNVTVSSAEPEYNALYTIVAAGPDAQSNSTYYDITSTGSVSFVAGTSVTLKPGFHAHTGGYFHASIYSGSKAADPGKYGHPTNYWYDGDGNRVKQIQQDPAYTRYYVSNGGNVLAEYDENNTLKCKYVYLNGKILAKVEGSDVYFNHNDYLGTARASTGASGVLFKTDTYYPFGEQYSSFGDNRKFNHKLTGKERDWSGLDYFGARYYDSRFGRFTTPDPLCFGLPSEAMLSKPQRLNKYIYCLNNPYRFTDPNGEAPLDWANTADAFLSKYVFNEGQRAIMSLQFGEAGAYLLEGSVRGSYDFLRFGQGTYYMFNSDGSNFEKTLYGVQDVARGAQVALTLIGIAGELDLVNLSRNGFVSRGSTAKVQPANLNEQLAIEQAMSSPEKGTVLNNIKMGDKRWPGWKGWKKMSQNVNGTEVHYNRNNWSGVADDFKIIR